MAINSKHKLIQLKHLPFFGKACSWRGLFFRGEYWGNNMNWSYLRGLDEFRDDNLRGLDEFRDDNLGGLDEFRDDNLRGLDEFRDDNLGGLDEFREVNGVNKKRRT